MWMGTNVPLPAREAAYFGKVGLKGATVTRRDDSRPCGYVEESATLPLPDARGATFVQVAVVADRWIPESRVKFQVGDKKLVQAGLQPGRWLDVRLELGDEEADGLQVDTDHPLWISAPKVVRQRKGKSGPKHVVVIVIDAMARRIVAPRRRLSNTQGQPITPNIDRFFSEGCHFPLGFSSSDWTLPTTSSFFTGLYPSSHRMVHPRFPMHHRTDRTLLFEQFQSHGFHTLFLSAGNRLTPAFDVHRGVDRFIYHWPYEGRSTFDYDPAVWVRELQGHLEAHREDTTFSYVHFPDTHAAWNVPPFTRCFNLGRRGDSTGHNLSALEHSATAGEQGEQLFFLRLHELDRLLGNLFDYIERKFGQEAIVVLTADHGSHWPGFLKTDPNEPISLNEFRIGTELWIRGPDIPVGSHEGVVSPNLDLMPTLLGLMGWDSAQDFHGADLFSDKTSRESVISESIYRSICELAVNDAEGQWIEKYPLDEMTTRITGPAMFKGWFPLGHRDYGSPVRVSDKEREDVVRGHLDQSGMKEFG